MKITIDIDSDKISDIVNNGIQSLSKDELKEIITPAIAGYIKEDPIIKSMFLSPCINRYSSDYRSSYEPTPLLKEIVSKIDFESECMPVVEHIKQVFNESCTDIIKQLILQSFTEFLGSQLFKSEHVKQVIDQKFAQSEMHIYQAINKG